MRAKLKAENAEGRGKTRGEIAEMFYRKNLCGPLRVFSPRPLRFLPFPLLTYEFIFTSTTGISTNKNTQTPIHFTPSNPPSTVTSSSV